jgi:hypothetical protein
MRTALRRVSRSIASSLCSAFGLVLLTSTGTQAASGPTLPNITQDSLATAGTNGFGLLLAAAFLIFTYKFIEYRIRYAWANSLDQKAYWETHSKGVAIGAGITLVAAPLIYTAQAWFPPVLQWLFTKHFG